MNPFLAEIWSFMFFHGGFLIITLKIMKRQASLFQDCSFICPSILLPNFFFISWILLKIVSLTAVPKTRFFSDLCFILMHHTLFWSIKMINNVLFWLVSINKQFPLKRYFWIKACNFLISVWLSIKISTNSQQKRYK